MADTEGVLRDRFSDGSGTGPELVLIPTGRFQMGSNEVERRKAMEAWRPAILAGARDAAALGRHRAADRDGTLSGHGRRVAPVRARHRLAAAG
ncbi:hypothetical protein LP419_01715 [Massilia sp. H-1]|nr:hypothetical protein LP419_01715 [Massilia sp. H-1]